jgi:anti-sigma factor RsiW
MNEREEIETLLPWFVTGKLAEAERVRVERYLAAHPDVARQVALAREERAETITGAESFGVPSRTSFDRLMAEVDRQERRQAGLLQSFAPYLERIADWIGGFSRVQLGGLAVAAALLLAVQAVTVTYLMTGGGATYQTASAPPDIAPERGTFALVSFRPTATAQEITAMLAEFGAQVVEGPKAGGIWRVRLSAEPLAAADAEARIASLRAKTAIVGFVSLSQ